MYVSLAYGIADIKFHRNLSSGTRADTCGQMERRTDMTHLIGAFRDYVNTLSNSKLQHPHLY